MSGAAVIGVGSEVRMHFTLSLEDGTVAEATRDSNVGGDPLTLVIGDGTLAPGLERALFGLRAGESRHVRLDAGDAFGERDPENVHALDRADFPKGLALEPGVVIGFDTPAGSEVPGTVVAVEGDAVRVDFNHPLAGRVLDFDVEIVSVDGGDRSDGPDRAD